MKFSTPVSIYPSPVAIDYNASILLLGSCFAENIAQKFAFFQFRHLVNPFGILFHPLAIDEAIHRAVNQQQYNASDVFLYNGRWHSFGVHSDHSHPDQQMMLQTLNKQQQALLEMLTTATQIIITYGTAWVYRDKASKNVVANCHKVPASQFDKELLSIDTLEAAVSNTISQIRSVNPKAQIIFTISPVRHIKDGMVENQRSKAHLIAALHAVIDANDNGSSCTYFPAYEILIDELRDYRFYADDLIHPSAMAIEFIWQRFVDAHIVPSAYGTMEQVTQVRKALAHRPFDKESPAHQDFLTSTQSQIDGLTAQYPHMKF